MNFVDTSSILPRPLRDPDKPSSPEIDTIECLKPAMSYTSSDNAKTHADIITLIHIKFRIIDQRHDTLK